MALINHLLSLTAILSFLQGANSFVACPRTSIKNPSTVQNMMNPITIVDAALSSNSLFLSETEAWVAPTAAIMDPFLNFMTLAMITRVVLSWYPTTNVKEFPWIAVVLPTEPFLRAVRGVIPPAFGVDITPIFWVAVFTFFHEIFLGQQGLLTLKIKYGI